MNGVLGSLLLLASVSAAPEKMWSDDYAAALEAARADQKPVLVVLHKPEDPQSSVKQVSYTTDAEQNAVLENYHLVQIDVTTPYGAKVAEAFGAKKFPYTAITSKSAKKVVFRKAGTFTDGEWTTTVSDHRNGVSPASYTLSTGTVKKKSYCPNCR